MNEEITIPDQIKEIFDQANMDSNYAAVLTATSVQLTTKDGKTVIREVKWDKVNEFSRNVLNNILSQVK